MLTDMVHGPGHAVIQVVLYFQCLVVCSDVVSGRQFHVTVLM